MTLFNEDFLFHHIDISKKPRCKNVKFKRAFQFLQLLLLQRVYGIDVLTRPFIRRSSKQCEFAIFLGGSCNPTTWRYEQAIPYFQSRAISYYNPQVANWTPDLVDIEHRAKELAPLLFFVIDHSTRSLAAIAEVCYLAARGKNIIVVMNRIPEEKNQTKFIQQKNFDNENDNEKDYKNVCEARQMLRILLQSISIPVFDDVKVALECAAFLIEHSKISESSEDSEHVISANITPLVGSSDWNFRQTSYLTHDNDDDGYGGSLGSSNRTLSRSSSPASSDFCELSSDDNKPSKFHFSIIQSFLILCTSPIRFIKTLFLPSMTYHFKQSTLYIASGEHDEYWLNTFVFPFLNQINVKYIRREMLHENDQFDVYVHKRSGLLYYLINDNERLSYLVTELAFLIGARQYSIIVCLQSTIKEDSEEILTKNERQDIERSRRYLEDLAKKEKIVLYQSREQSWQRVLAFFSSRLIFF